MSTESMPYEVKFTAGDVRFSAGTDEIRDEIRAEHLDEACDIAESLLPEGWDLHAVEGPDGCRLFDETPVRSRPAAPLAA